MPSCWFKCIPDIPASKCISKCLCSDWEMNFKEWSSHLLDNLNNCLKCAPENFAGVFNGIRTHDLRDASAVLLPTEILYDATQMWARQFVRLVCSHKRNDEWKKCLCSVVECLLRNVYYWPSTRLRWLDIGQVLFLHFYGLRQSRGP